MKKGMDIMVIVGGMEPYRGESQNRLNAIKRYGGPMSFYGDLWRSSGILGLIEGKVFECIWSLNRY